MVRENKMTAWEAGNDLCACADYLGEKEVDAFNAGFIEHAKMLRECRIRIAKHFNHYHPEHGFGLGPTEPRKP
jgi:hypothetical protein